MCTLVRAAVGKCTFKAAGWEGEQRSQLLVVVSRLLPKPSTCLGHETKASAVAEHHSVALERLSEEVTTGSVILPKMVIFELSELRN